MRTCGILLHHVHIGVILKSSIKLDDVLVRQPRMNPDLTLHLRATTQAAESHHIDQRGQFPLAAANQSTSMQCMMCTWQRLPCHWQLYNCWQHGGCHLLVVCWCYMHHEVTRECRSSMDQTNRVVNCATDCHTACLQTGPTSTMRGTPIRGGAHEQGQAQH